MIEMVFAHLHLDGIASRATLIAELREEWNTNSERTPDLRVPTRTVHL